MGRVLVLILLLWPLPLAAAPAITTAPASYVVVSVTGGPAGAFDWVGLFNINAPDSQWTDWLRLSNRTKFTPKSGVANGTVTFKVPASGGPWEARFFGGSGYSNKLATSAQFGGALKITIDAQGPGTFLGWAGDPGCTAVPMILTSNLTCTAVFGP
jgi:hypothetical protein